MRILYSGSKAQDKRDSGNHALSELYLHVAFWAPNHECLDQASLDSGMGQAGTPCSDQRINHAVSCTPDGICIMKSCCVTSHASIASMKEAHKAKLLDGVARTC